MVFIFCILIKLCLFNVFKVFDMLLIVWFESVVSLVIDFGCCLVIIFNNCWFFFDSILVIDLSELN